jgi:hypothetical protein
VEGSRTGGSPEPLNQESRMKTQTFEHDRHPHHTSRETTLQFAVPALLAQACSGGSSDWSSTEELATMDEEGGQEQSGDTLVGRTAQALSAPCPSATPQDYGLEQEWSAGDVRLMADLNGDNPDDILGIRCDSAYVSYATGNGFTDPERLM